MVFRSFTGAAPLKPAPARPTLRSIPSLPLLHRSGPIEARLSPRDPSAPAGVFRSFTGAAPLKPAHVDHGEAADAMSSAPSPERPH